MIVVDASVLAVALLDSHADGARARARLHGEDMAAPALIDFEVASVWRGLARAGTLSDARAEDALEDLRSLPLQRADHLPLLARCWELRHNLSAYDASYVALAELLGTVLVTGDRRLSNATGPRCPIEILS